MYAANKLFSKYIVMKVTFDFDFNVYKQVNVNIAMGPWTA